MSDEKEAKELADLLVRARNGRLGGDAPTIALALRLLAHLVETGTVSGFDWEWEVREGLKAVCTIEPPELQALTGCLCDEPGEGG